MNWPLVVRYIAEHYGYTPTQIGELTIEQVWLLSVDENDLKRKRTMTATPEELKRKGLLDEGEDSVSLYDLLYPPKAKMSRAQKRHRRLAAVSFARSEG
jgi:hypothetical protein